ncbi:hypothetical protein B0H12DRAFT_220501 [Mycena haematopus]|nr:hypothetical protein B0H12DRAFT_220501 [Mycena haematopus]
MVSWNKILGVASVAAATALLGMVAFDVPYFKSVYFLRIDLGNGTASTAAANQTNPFIDLGALGFCTDLKTGLGLQCSKAQVGYNLSDFHLHKRNPPSSPDREHQLCRIDAHKGPGPTPGRLRHCSYLLRLCHPRIPWRTHCRLLQLLLLRLRRFCRLCSVHIRHSVLRAY